MSGAGYHESIGGLIFVYGIMAAAVWVFLYSMLTSWRAGNWLKHHPEQTLTATAQITKVFPQPPNKIYIVFTFTDHGGKIRVCSQTLQFVSSMSAFGSKAGDTAEVVYNRKYNSLYYIKGYDQNYLQNVGSIIPYLALLAFGWYLFFRYLN